MVMGVPPQIPMIHRQIEIVDVRSEQQLEEAGSSPASSLDDHV